MDRHAQHRETRIVGDASDASARQRGVTLIELMIVLLVIAILLATAVPGVGRLLSNQRAAGVVNDLVHAIALARSEAQKRGRRVYLAPTGLHWRDGWAVFVDRDDDRVFDAAFDEAIALHDALPASVAVTNAANADREPFTDLGSPQRTYLMFDGNGFPRQRNGGFNAGSWVVTDRTGGATTVRTVCLASYGRVRVVVDRVGCS